MIMPGVDRRAGRGGPAKETTSSHMPYGESYGRGVGGALLRQDGKLTQATVLVPRSAFTTGLRDLGIVETHRLKAVAHACEARTALVRWAVPACGVGITSGLGGDPTGAVRVCRASRPPYHVQNCCATTSLTRPQITRTLDLANVAGREDHSQ